MQVALSDLKVNVGKFVDLASSEDVTITKYGKPTAKIISFDKEPWYLKKYQKLLHRLNNYSEPYPTVSTLTK